MPHHLTEFIAEVERKRRSLNTVKSKQIHSSKVRDELRVLVEEYFKNIRPSVFANNQQDQDLAEVDSRMQDLLALCHKRGSTNKYKQLLAQIRKALILIDGRLLVDSHANTVHDTIDRVDQLIISTLKAMLPGAALSYEQALNDLLATSRLSWRGPATDLREALRETLDHLARDTDVNKMPGYKQVPDTHGPTMKQKVRYILKNRGTSRSLQEPAVAATDSIEAAMGSFVRSVYTRTNVSTHTPTDKDEVLRIRDLVRVVLCELLAIRT